MSLVTYITRSNSLATFTRLTCAFYSTTSQGSNPEVKMPQDEFRVLNIRPKSAKFTKKKVFEVPCAPPRTNKMPTDQDWMAVWPGPRTFHPATVPLPIRQGYPKKNSAPPSKYGNAELMKIPNFLHLTPPAIKRQCEALKQFCTDWPAELEVDNQHFPLTYISSDYCYSSPTIREPLSRIVTISIKLSQLKLDAHAKDKMLRLLGERYNPETDDITIVADRCPTKKQNREYAEYLLTAVFNEAWRVEPWEAEKSIIDSETYEWDKNVSRKSLVTIHAWPSNPPENLEYDNIPNVDEYKDAVVDLMNNGEDSFTLNKYRESVKGVLHLR